MPPSRIDLLLVDVDQTLISGTLAEGDAGQLNENVVQLVEDANARGATVVILSNHPLADDLRALTRRDRRLARSVSGCIAVTQPKLLMARLLLDRLGIPPASALLVDDDPANVSEFVRHGIAATSDVTAASERIRAQPVTEPEFRRKRNEMRRVAIDLFERSTGPMLPATTLAYLAERRFLVEVRPCVAGDYGRVAELFARTNQLHFNPAVFATRAPDEIEVAIRTAAAEGQQVFVASLSIGGTDLGIQAVALLACGVSSSEIVNAALSCSVLPFSVVEPIFIKRVLALHGKTPVTVRITDTSYNSRVRGILAACGGDYSSGNCVFTTVPPLTPDEERFSSRSPLPALLQEDGVPPITTFFDTHVMPLLLDMRGGSVLELGFGYGEMLGDMRHQTLMALASKIGTKLIRSDLEPVEKDIVRLDAQAMPSVPDASVDVVFALDLVEHVDRPAEVFAEIARVLKPGGYLFLSAPGVAYPFHPFAEDRHRYTGAFLRGIGNLGFRIAAAEDQNIGDSAVRTILLAKRAPERATNTAVEWFTAARKTPLLDGLILYDAPPRSLLTPFRATAKRLRTWNRSEIVNALVFLVGIVTLGIMIERIYNAALTQLLSTSVSMVTDDELYEQGLELLANVQHERINYYDEIASRIILAKLCNSRISYVHFEGAKLFVPKKRFLDAQWAGSVLENVRFEDCTFSRLGLRDVQFAKTTDLLRCQLRDLTGSRITLLGNLYDTTIQRSRFTSLNAYDLIVKGGEWSDVEVHGEPGTFNTAYFEDVKFRNVTFSDCDFQQATFLNCEFDTVRFQSSNLSEAVINNCRARGVEVDEDTARKTSGGQAEAFVKEALIGAPKTLEWRSGAQQ